MNKKFLKLIIFAMPLFFVLSAAVVLARVDASLPLPIGAAKAPKGSAVVQQIYLLFQFGLGAIGIVAFGSIIYGAVKYMAAAGDPSAINEAKGRIFSALWGIGIALTSVILLGTINPDLVNFLATGNFTKSIPNVRPLIQCGQESENDKTITLSGACKDKTKSCHFDVDQNRFKCMTDDEFYRNPPPIKYDIERENEYGYGLEVPPSSE